MVERQVSDHAAYTKTLVAKAMTNKPDAIKELIDYLTLSHSSGCVHFSILIDLSAYAGFAFSRHAEVILERGIALIQLHPSYVKGKSKKNWPTNPYVFTSHRLLHR